MYWDQRSAGLAIEQPITQQLDLLFQIDDVSRISLLDLPLARKGSVTYKQHLPEQNGIIGRLSGNKIMARIRLGQATKRVPEPDSDGCARGRSRRVTSSVPGRSG